MQKYIILGHENPDVDSIVSGYIYQNYLRRRNIDAEFNKIPLDSSIKMDDELMGMLEPFDYNGLQNFEMGYLSGYMAEKFNYSSQDLIEKAKKQAKDGAYNIAVREIKG